MIDEPKRRRGRPAKAPDDPDARVHIGMRIKRRAVEKARALGPDRLAEIILAAD